MFNLFCTDTILYKFANKEKDTHAIYNKST